MLSNELNDKFGFNSKVVKHKSSFVIQFNTKDANKLHDLIKFAVIDSMKYKIPRKIV